VFLTELAKVETPILLNRLHGLKRRFRNWPQLCEEIKNAPPPVATVVPPVSLKEEDVEEEEEEFMEEEELKIINNQYVTVS
jgi:hypothetical protein